MSHTQFAPRPTSPNAPHAVAHDVLDRLQQAWNAGDGDAFGRVYATDASFVNIHGSHILGRGAIAAGHAGIFGTIYAGSTNQIDLLEAEEVAPGVVVAVSRNTLDCPAGPLAGRHQAMSTSVVTRSRDGSWQVVSTHNTIVGH